MKQLSALIVTLIVSVANASGAGYTGSTPAGEVVRTFLSIPASDSIDFIRWKLTMTDGKYILSCNYGISQPNTNGFFGGGKWVERKGTCKKEESFCYLLSGDKSLSLFVINSNLLQITDKDNNLLVGNGGWSYTLNNTNPSVSNPVNVAAKAFGLTDSIVYQGRTPCFVGNNRQSENCYKLKWRMVLFSLSLSDKSPTCFINGTIFNHKQQTGTWSILEEKNRNPVYRIVIADGSPYYLLKLDENIMLFTDAQGNPLVGNEDFSFTLNKVL